MVKVRALNADPAIDGIAMATLERLVTEASAYGSAKGTNTGANDEGHLGQGHKRSTFAGPAPPLELDGP